MKKACDGLVLRVTDSGENDRALTVLTAEEGKLHIIAKGARSVAARWEWWKKEKNGCSRLA